MKIDLDLSEIFMEGGADVNQSIKEAIISSVVDRIYRSIEKAIQDKVDRILENGITAKIKETMDALMPEILNYEFAETSHYGVSQKTITVKNRILQDIAKEMVWRDGNWDSDKSAYTKILKAIVGEWMGKFKPEFDKQVNQTFVKEAMEYAQKKLAEKLGIK